jgi:biopolymer transport protein ExbD
MAFSSNSGGGPMAEINVTPLVDVMLVLLIIFMITAPLMSHKVQIKLPEAALENGPEPPIQPITLAIKDTGEIFWDDQPIDMLNLEAQLYNAGQKTPQPQVDIRADSTTRYKIIRDVVKLAKLNGIRKIGFVATPEH